MLHKPIIIFAAISVNIVYTLGVPMNGEFIEPEMGQLLFPRVDSPPHIPSNSPPSSLQGSPLSTPSGSHPAANPHNPESIRREQEAYVESVTKAVNHRKRLASDALVAAQPETEHDIPATVSREIEHNFAYAHAYALHRHIIAKSRADSQLNPAIVTKEVQKRAEDIVDIHRHAARLKSGIPYTTARIIGGVRRTSITNKRHPILNPHLRSGASADALHQIGLGSSAGAEKHPYVAGVAAAAERERHLASKAIAASNPTSPSPHDLPADVGTQIAHNYGYTRAIALQVHTGDKARRIGSMLPPALTSDLRRQAGEIADFHHVAAAQNANIVYATARYMAGTRTSSGRQPDPSKAEEQDGPSKKRRQ